MSSFVYIITCIPSGKAYIGVSKDPKVRWQQHQEAARHAGPWALCRAIRKYGPESFDCQVIEEHASQTNAFEAEKRWIRSLRENGVRLYNMTQGGEGIPGYCFSSETRARISVATKKAMSSPEVREKISAKRKRHPGPNKGKKFSTETCAKISAARTGRGHSHTQETRARMSLRRTLYWTRLRFFRKHDEFLDYLTKKSDK